MELDYEELKYGSELLSAALDILLEETPDDQELKELQEFLADRYRALLFLSQ